VQLNPAQRAAVLDVDAPMLVLAGAGSGKTRVITAKIAHLLRSGLAPEQIFAVTFTNRAAREMSERVVDTAGRDGAKVAISTFHRLGLRILREDPRAAGLKGGFSIYDATDAESLLRELLRLHFGGDVEAPQLREMSRAAAGVISNWKNDLKTPDEVAGTARSSLERTQAAVYRDYVSHLRASSAVDFDDLILLPVLALRTSAERRGLWQARIRHLLVDEYQDTNGCQYALLRLLAGDAGRFTVVGDDDQSIYAWRGARPDNLNELAEDYPALQVVKLEQNYRSRSNILRAANALIDHNPHLFEKRLWSERGPGDPVRIVEVEDEVAEVDRIAGEIVAHQTRHAGDWGDYAVVYRSNHQVKEVELRLQALKVPYRVSGGSSFFDRGEIRDVIAYFRLLVNPDDDGAFLRVVNVPRRQIGAATLSALQGIASRRGGALLAAVGDSALVDAAGSGAGRLRAFAATLASHRARLREPGKTPADVLRALLQECDYAGWLDRQDRGRNGEPSRARSRFENVEILLRAVARRTAEGDSPEEALRSLVLEDPSDEDEPGPHQVQLLTLHASKGLEFPHVWIMGLEEGVLPHRNSVSEDAIREERRLAYVGITRAMESLTLTLTRSRRLRGETITTAPSRFLAELPAEYVRWEGRRDEPAEQKQARAEASLAALKSLLD
jgi:ATP-dependent DNA helicase Rep